MVLGASALLGIQVSLNLKTTVQSQNARVARSPSCQLRPQSQTLRLCPGDQRTPKDDLRIKVRQKLRKGEGMLQPEPRKELQRCLSWHHWTAGGALKTGDPRTSSTARVMETWSKASGKSLDVHFLSLDVHFLSYNYFSSGRSNPGRCLFKESRRF